MEKYTEDIKKKSTTLIIGSNSYIGSALMFGLQSAGKAVLGTTRRRDIRNKDYLFLDLSDDVRRWECPASVDVAVVCAGISKLETCRQDPAASFRVNVDGVSNLINKLTERGVFVIYLSTNHVFDGSSPYRLPDDKISPITEYGKQKAEVEKRINKIGDLAATVRLTKILGPQMPLFLGWREALLKGEAIHPFSNIFIAPVPLSFVTAVLAVLIERRLPGILQVSSSKDISYAEAAYIGAQFLKRDKNLVQPITSHRTGYYTEHTPSHTTLDISRLKSALGMEPPDVGQTIRAAFESRGEIKDGK